MFDLKRKAGKFFGGDKFSSSVVTVLVVLVALVFNVVLSTLVSVFDWTYAYEERGDYSLSGSTDELFSEAIEKNKKVTVYFCMTGEDLEVHSTGAEVYETAKNFVKKYPDFIEIKYINILTRRDQDGKLVNLSKYQTDMYGNETRIYKTSVIFECGKNYRVVTDTYTSGGFAPFFTLDSNYYAVAYNGEEVMASMISWVCRDEHKQAYFTQYHGESADLAFSNLLASAGYYVDVIDLRKQEVPADADLLIISNPTSDFETSREGSGIRTEMDRLKTYIERGGNLYVALDPYVKTLSVLEGFLAEHGIAFSTTETAIGSTKNLVNDSRNAITTDGFTLVTNYAGGALAKTISDKVSDVNGGSVIVRDAAALELSGNAAPLLVSSSASVLEANGSTVSSSGSYCVAAASTYTGEDGAVANIFVVPSVYLTVSDALISYGYSNKDFVYALFDEYFGAGEMPYGCRAVLYETDILQNLTMGTAKLYTALIMLVPVCIAAVGAVRITRRKNR